MKTYQGSKDPQGSSIINALSPDSWARLVREKVEMPITLDVTREEYAKLRDTDHERSRRIKSVREYVMPGIFEFDENSNPRRRKELLKGVALLGLDYDTDDKSPVEFIAKLKSYATGDVLADKLGSLNFVAYKTISHTEAYPRLRVLVDCDGIEVKDYAASVDTISKILGMDGMHDKNCESPVLPMSMPILFKGGEMEQPIISSRINGVPFVATMIDVPLVDDISEFDTGPVPGIPEEEATKALSFLSPDMEYGEWVKVGMALKHQFGDKGFTVWDEWSKKGKDYKPLEMKAKWETFTASSKAGPSITFRAVMEWATAKGWSYAEAAGKARDELLKWMRDPVRTEMEVWETGTKRAAALPKEEHDMMARNISAELRGRFKVDRKASEVAKKIAKAASPKKAPPKSLPGWARGWVHVGTQYNEFYNWSRSKREPWSERAFNAAHTRLMYPSSIITSPEDTAFFPVQAWDYLLNNVRIPSVDGYLYDPTHPNDKVVTQDGVQYVNKYRADYQEAEPALEAQAKALWDRQMELTCKEPQCRVDLTDFCAYLVQHPGKKVYWMPLLRGPEGSGKSVIWEIMRGCLGPSNVKHTKGHTVVDTSWSDFTEGYQLIALEELKVHGASGKAGMDKLKDVIAQEYVETVRKYHDPRMVKNITNYIGCSNELDALVVDLGSRRYEVIESALFSPAEIAEARRTHYSVLQPFKAEHPGAFRSMFLNHKISPTFDPTGCAPSSQAFLDMVDMSRTPLENLVTAMLSSGSNPLVRPDMCVTEEVEEEAKAKGITCWGTKDICATLRKMGFVNTREGDPRYVMKCGVFHIWRKAECSPQTTAHYTACIARAKGQPL